MAENKHFPERTCVGCFKKFPQADLIAVTRLLAGEVIVQIAGNTPGRSAYLCRNIICLTRAKNRKGKNGLEYSLKVKILDPVWEQLDKVIKNNTEV